MSGGPATVIARAGVRADRLDPVTTRLRLEQLLARADLRPPGLAPAAVLCVRRLADPLPGGLALDAAPAGLPLAWEQAAVAALEALLRGAARPAREAVPAGADAVLFADRAELLACLARDAAAGVAWSRWWWRGALTGPPARGDPVLAAWRAAPEHVPAALALLVAQGEAAPFVRAVTPAAALELAAAAATAHGAGALSAVLRAAVPEASAPAVAPPPAVRAVAAPWRAVAPEAAALAPSRPREALAGIALALRRAPVPARAASFAAATAAWLAAPQAPPAPRPARPAATPRRAPRATGAPPGATVRSRPPGTQAPPRATRPAPPPAPAAPPTPTVARPPAAPVRFAAPAAPAAPAPGPPPPPGAAHPGPTEPAARAPAPPRPLGAPAPRADPTTSPPRPRPARPEPRTSRAAPPAPRRALRSGPTRAASAEPPAQEPAITAAPRMVDTELGGAFYLLDLALFLELYGDFTTPLSPGIALDPWDLLALLVPALLGERPPDPLWRLLAGLAGRPPRRPPGAGFRPPPAWRTPRAWLAPFPPDGEWTWSAGPATLRIRHPAGFLAAAVPRTAAPVRTQLARELGRLGGPPVRRAALGPEPRDPRARWVARLAGYAQARLRLALGRDDAAPFLVRRHARVHVTPAHVDVVFSLADHAIDIRYAGLDRTPGWIPAAGRFVELHFR